MYRDAVLLASNIKNAFYDDVLSSQVSYSYVIKVVNNLGYNSSSTAKVLTPSLIPSAPTAPVVTINPNKTNEVTVSWTKIADADLDYYQVKLNADTWTNAIKTTGTLLTYEFSSGIVSGLQTFNIRAVNRAGFASNQVDVSKTMKFEPADVAGFTATLNPNDKRNVLLAWNNSTEGDISHYKIKYGVSWAGGTEVTSKNILTNFYNEFYSQTEQTVNFWIKAYNKQGKESTNAVNSSAIVTLVPTKPATGSYLVDAKNRFSLTVSWSSVSDLDLIGYELVYRNTDGTETVIYFGKETSYKHVVDAVDGTHTFKVRSKNLSGFYSPTLSIVYTVATAPSNITGFTVTQNSLDRRVLNLSWNTNTDGDFAYYRVKKGATWESGTVVADRLTTPSHSIILTTEESASYHVKAINAGGKESSDPATQPVDIRLIPLKPVSGSITQDINDKSILAFRWDRSADLDISYYEVTVGGVTSQIRETYMNYYPSDLNILNYSFSVKAVNIGDKKSTALDVSATVYFTPSDVDGLAVSQSINDHTKINLSWNAISERDIASYRITRTRSGSQEVKTYSNITQTFYEDTIDNEDTFTWSVIAINKCGKQSVVPFVFSSPFNMNPTAPTEITLKQSSTDRSICYISFTGVGQQDLKEYEIKVGSDWETATPITKTKETTNIQWNPPQSGAYKILIKAKKYRDWETICYHFKKRCSICRR